MVENNNIAISAWGDLYEPVSKALQGAGTAASEMKDNFGGLSGAQNKATYETAEVASKLKNLTSPLAEAVEALGRLNEAIYSLSTQASPEKSRKGEEGFGWPFWFLNADKEYKDAKDRYIQDLDEIHGKLEELFGEEKGFAWYENLFGKREEFAAKEFAAIRGYDVLNEESAKSVQNVRSKAYSAMETQLLRLVETHRFSARTFGDVIAQEVKTELTGIAARATVWAVYETAMGLKDLAGGFFPTAALHFKSAAEFGAVAGMSLAGAAAIQESFFGGASREPSSSGGGSSSSGGTQLSLDTGAETKSTQNVTVHVYNPLSDQNWQKIVEDNIIPALKEAGDRNISVTVKNLG